jgi:hypothetical protein
VTEVKKVFSYDEAAALLPAVREATDGAFRRVESLAASAEPKAREQADAIVQEWARGMLARGLEVKGLWLVDFDNGSGYYCWRYPEPGLQFYHSYEDGFGGRMRIQ